jgi:hypothetical protein
MKEDGPSPRIRSVPSMMEWHVPGFHLIHVLIQCIDLFRILHVYEASLRINGVVKSQVATRVDGKYLSLINTIQLPDEVRGRHRVLAASVELNLKRFQNSQPPLFSGVAKVSQLHRCRMRFS